MNTPRRGGWSPSPAGVRAGAAVGARVYFLAACHHLARGYVDYPPLIALIGRAVLSRSARPWTRFARRRW
jgi:hypothetical protein